MDEERRITAGVNEFAPRTTRRFQLKSKASHYREELLPCEILRLAQEFFPKLIDFRHRSPARKSSGRGSATQDQNLSCGLQLAAFSFRVGIAERV